MNSRTLALFACALAASAAFPNSVRAQAFGNASISAVVLGSTMTITTRAQFAGAISSLVWRNAEFINRTDHGRELQSASSFDGLGECFNPTEGGSRRDGAGPTSTSLLLGLSAAGPQLATTTQMAFWTPAGDPYPQGCGGNPAITVAQNTTDRSNHVLDKRVTIGFNGIQNVLEYLVTFHTAENHGSGTFEALTGYMPPQFSSFWTYDPRTISLSPLSAGPGEQSLPVILSTGAQNLAMGIYSPDLPQGGNGYGRFAFPDTMKWNAVYRTASTPAGAYSFRNYVVVGNLQEVKQGISAVYQMFQSSIANVYRFYRPSTGEHFFSTSSMEGPIAGFAAEGVGFMVLAAPAPGTMPLYRCYVPNFMHFISTDPNCEGQVSEGAYGHVYASQVAGSAPLYRFYLPGRGDHLETTDFNEGAGAGYVFEGVLGYVPTQGG